MTKKLLIDTDGGVDDALAILAALGSGAEVVALTTVAGNVDVNRATRNAALIRRMFDPACAVPVSQGAPAGDGGLKRRAAAIHGRDGLGGISALTDEDGGPRYMWPDTAPSPLCAAAQIAGRCARHGSNLTLAFIGPLSNLAQVIRSHGVRALNGARVVFMGGSFRAGHNRPRRADFNVAADVAATETVLSSGLALDLVTLEACERYILTRQFLAHMAHERPSPKAQFIFDIHQQYMDYYARQVIKSVDGCYPHDTIAVACALRPDLFTFERRAVGVVAQVNGTYGHTVARPGGTPNVRVVTGFDADAFEACLVQWVWA